MSSIAELTGAELIAALKVAGFFIPIDSEDLPVIQITTATDKTPTHLSATQQAYIKSVSRAAVIQQATEAKQSAETQAKKEQAKADAKAASDQAVADSKSASEALDLKNKQRQDRASLFTVDVPTPPTLDRTTSAAGSAGSPNTAKPPDAPDDFSVTNAGPIDFDGLDGTVWTTVSNNCKFCKGRFQSDLTTLAPRDLIAFPDSKLISSYFVASDISEVFSTEFDYDYKSAESLKMTSWDIKGSISSPWGGASFSHNESSEDSLFASQTFLRAVTKYQLPVGYADFSYEICICDPPCHVGNVKDSCVDKIVFSKEFMEDINKGVMKEGINPRYLSYNKDVKPLVKKYGDCFAMHVSIGLGTTVEHDSTLNTNSDAHAQKKATAAGVSAGAFGCNASFSGGTAAANTEANSHVSGADKWMWSTIGGSVMGNNKNPRSLAEHRQDLKSFRVTHIHKLVSFIDVIPEGSKLRERLNGIVLRDTIPFPIEPVSFIIKKPPADSTTPPPPPAELEQALQTARALQFRLPDNARLLGFKQEIYTAAYNAYFTILLPMFRYPGSSGCIPNDPVLSPAVHKMTSIEDYNYHIIQIYLLPANTPYDLALAAAIVVFDMFRIEDLVPACTLFCGHITQAFNPVATRPQCMNALYLLFCMSCMVTTMTDLITSWTNVTSGAAWPPYMPWVAGSPSPKQTREPLALIANDIINAVQAALTAEGNILSAVEGAGSDQWLYINYMFAILRALCTMEVTTPNPNPNPNTVEVTFTPLKGIVFFQKTDLQKTVTPAIVPNEPFTLSIASGLWGASQTDFEKNMIFLPLFSFINEIQSPPPPAHPIFINYGAEMSTPVTLTPYNPATAPPKVMPLAAAMKAPIHAPHKAGILSRLLGKK